MKTIHIKAAQKGFIFRFENLSKMLPITNMNDLQQECLADC